MIRDGGFEKEWDHRYVWVCERGQQPKRMQTPNCFIPPDWQFWWEQGPDLHLPEVTDAWKHLDPYRVKSGEKAIQYFKSFDQYHAGFYQQVDDSLTIFLASKEMWGFCHNNSYWDDVKLTENNGTYTLKAWCHAWSNHNETIPGAEECKHDPRCSYGVGKSAYFARAGDIPPLVGDPWTDAIGNVQFRIGIDTTGGTNPLSNTVKWSGWFVSYNKHGLLEHTVNTNQQQPHVDYEVTVHTPAQSVESFERVFDKAKDSLSSIVPSHDDTGRLCNVICPSGQGGLAILYDIPKEQRKDYIDFYAERYPLTRVTFAGEEQPTPWDSYLLAQGDPRWADYVYANGQCYTLKSQGCWITACAMAQRIFLIDANATPVTVDKELGTGGYTQCLMLHSMMPLLGLEVAGSTTDISKAKRHIDSGGLLFIEVEPQSMMHFVVGVEYQGDDFLVLDPWKNRVAWLSELYSGAESFRLIKEVENTPPPPPPPAQGVELVGLHLQHMEEGWDTLYGHANTYDVDPIAKVFSPEDVLHILRRCPNANVVVRPYISNQHPYLYPANENFEHAAKLWVDHMRDSLYRVCDEIAREFPGREPPYFIYESVNEEYENVNDDKNRRAAAIDAAVASEVYNTGYPITAGIMCAAVGNPDSTQFYHLVQLAQRTKLYSPWWAYHGYFLRNMQYGGPAHLWQYLAGRFEKIQEVLPYEVPWYFGESGAIGGKSSPPEPAAAAQSIPPDKEIIWIRIPAEGLSTQDTDGWVAMYPNDGWKHPEVYNGNWAKHQQEVEQLQALSVQAVERFKGLVLFTSCAPYMGWKHFWVKSPQMESLIS